MAVKLGFGRLPRILITFSLANHNQSLLSRYTSTVGSKSSFKRILAPELLEPLDDPRLWISMSLATDENTEGGTCTDIEQGGPDTIIDQTKPNKLSAVGAPSCSRTAGMIDELCSARGSTSCQASGSIPPQSILSRPDRIKRVAQQK